MKTLLALFTTFALFSGVHAQPNTQTVRGRIVDAQSEFPLAGVNITLLDTDPQLYYSHSN